MLPAGMRNNNPGNIKWFDGADRRFPGALRPSVNRDQGDPQIVFATHEDGLRALASLASRKYDGGKHTLDQFIAGNGGWTPGNHAAAANVARTMGISPYADINLHAPGQMQNLIRGLTRQEHGEAASFYTPDMVAQALGASQGASATPSRGGSTPSSRVSPAPVTGFMPASTDRLANPVLMAQGMTPQNPSVPMRMPGQAMPQFDTSVDAPSTGINGSGVPGMSRSLDVPGNGPYANFEPLAQERAVSIPAGAGASPASEGGGFSPHEQAGGATPAAAPGPTTPGGLQAEPEGFDLGKLFSGFGEGLGGGGAGGGGMVGSDPYAGIKNAPQLYDFPRVSGGLHDQLLAQRGQATLSAPPAPVQISPGFNMKQIGGAAMQAPAMEGQAPTATRRLFG